jgi:hypothetical protein
MKAFKRGKHKAIIIDEGHHRMVFSDKQLFQAGLDEVCPSQRNGQEHAYHAWLYSVPLIGPAIEWMLGAEIHERQWLNANSRVITVDDPLWLESVPVLTN